jgi:tRNA uridine 5-carbamoylmethylation protein Kti12
MSIVELSRQIRELFKKYQGSSPPNKKEAYDRAQLEVLDILEATQVWSIQKKLSRRVEKPKTQMRFQEL